MSINLANSNDNRSQPEQDEQDELSEEQAKSVSGGLAPIPEGDLYPSRSGNNIIPEHENHLSQ